MRIAVLAMQEQARLRRAGELALKESEVDVDDPRAASAEGFAIDVDDPDGDARRAAVVQGAWRLLVARLTGAAVTRASLEDLRAHHGEDPLLVAVGGVANELLSLPGLTDRDVSAVARARADARTLIAAPVDVAATPALAAAAAAALISTAPLSSPPSPSSAKMPAASTTAPTLIPAPSAAPPADPSMLLGGKTVQRVIARVVGAAISGDDDAIAAHVHVPAVDAAPLVLLRARAQTASSARSLHGVANDALARLPVRTLDHAVDELLVGAGTVDDALLDGSAIDDAVAVLVRAAAALAAALPAVLPEHAPVAFSVVVVGVHGDVVDAVVRAGAQLPRAGLLALDDDAWLRAGELATAPGETRAVDARTPWGVDRWQLSAALPRAPFVGRDDDVAACAAVLASSSTTAPVDPGRPRLLVLSGAPGLGKASLVRRGLQQAGLLDERAVVLWGAADPLQPTPYASIVGMVRALARAPAGHPRAAARVLRLVQGLADALVDDATDDATDDDDADADELRGLGPVLVELIGANDDDVDVDRSPRALRAAIRRAVLLMTRALRARAKDDRPAVFVVSGADDIDAPTRDTLAFVARHLGAHARVVLLATARPRLPSTFEELFDVTRRDIEPLDAPAAHAIAAALLGDDAAAKTGTEGPTGTSGSAAAADTAASVADSELVVSFLEDDALPRALAVLHERAKGSPLFIAHGLRWAVEGGLLQKRPDAWNSTATRWDATRFADAAVAGRMPSRLDKLLAARVLRLPQAARQVLGHCAVLGHLFTPAAVFFVGERLGLSRAAVADAVKLLTATGFLAPSRPRPGAPVFGDDAVVADDDELLAFEHPLLRAAAEQALSADEAAAVHGTVALALEALLEPRAIAPTLARHHRMAERRRAALEHLVVAARRARRLDDRAGALAMAREGLDLCLPDEHDTLFALQLEHCAVLEPTAAHGEKQQAALKDALKQLVRCAERTGDGKNIATAFARVARFHLFVGDADRAEESALRALERARGAVDAAVVQGDDVDARVRGVRDALRLLALVRFARHDVDGARRALDEARRLTRPDERRVLGVLEHQSGLFDLESNEPLAALEHLLVARAHKHACGDPAGEAAVVDAAADVFVRTGRLPQALALLSRAQALRERQGDDAGIAHGEKNRAEVLLLLGDVDGASASATRARGLARGLALERLERQAVLVLARAALARDDAAGAETLLDNVRRRVDDERDPFSAMEADLLSARVKWLRAQRASGAARERLLKTAHARATAAVVTGERRGFLSGQVLGNALVGDVLVSSGDAGLALPYALRAVELLDDRAATGLPVEEALSAVARVHRAVGDDDEAEAALARARALLHERAERLPVEARARFWSIPARKELIALADDNAGDVDAAPLTGP
jgi:tetratricopeptide (TPR) repeat protein